MLFDTLNPLTYVSGPMDLSTASYDPSTGTCTNVACHLLQTSVDFGAPFRPSNTAECNSCHEM